MVIQAQSRCYQVTKTAVTHETFRQYYKLAGLENELQAARAELERTPGNQRRRIREKIWRLQQRIDVLRLTLQS